MTNRVHVVVDGPFGPVTVVAHRGAVTNLLLHVRPDVDDIGECEPDVDPLPAAAAQLREYFAGERTEFDLPLAPEGTEFQHRVWALLRAIPYGETRSYGDLAHDLGRPGAARAVGGANNRNPIAIVVPCHRVIGADGRFVGFDSGVAHKVALLDLERRTAGRADVAPTLFD